MWYRVHAVPRRCFILGCCLLVVCAERPDYATRASRAVKATERPLAVKTSERPRKAKGRKVRASGPERKRAALTQATPTPAAPLAVASTATASDAPASDAPTSAAHGRAPSCNGCARRESVLARTMHLESYSRLVHSIGAGYVALAAVALAVAIALCCRAWVSPSLLLTLFYSTLYLVASPTAILVNKILMKDYGFGYPVMVSGLGQAATALGATLCVHIGGASTEGGRQVPVRNLFLLGGASALALVLGQYPYVRLALFQGPAWHGRTDDGGHFFL